jgi:lysophospholipase L1-like esterase
MHLKTAALLFGGMLISIPGRCRLDERGWLKENCSGDGIHPNAEGYKVMTPIVEAALQKALP